MAKVVYFASLRERLGRSEERYSLTTGVPVITLMEQLIAQHGEYLAAAFNEGQIMIAVNQEMADRQTIVTDGDEVAFFPPVTGG
ncbi:MAG: molybdopterin converting factor subunit 1 [Neptuniibacter caesariensis]|uniref:Molybdopterin synthase sulfur carrier subunit n=1 Tax=Neptuniibacter caesariensis TaxID=207954 RepID=A0A2G6JAN1_NEPCE|nr:MAG: molybdopterin converting factor subunit 1 [Neptuniibacter caesariensis]